jgi:hypothetical protein
MGMPASAFRVVMMGEVGTATLEILAIALFAIHVAMQRISFESIAKCSMNEIIKSTNLKHHLLLSEGLRLVLVLLPHCFIPLSHLFIMPPHFFFLLLQPPKQQRRCLICLGR